MAQIDKLLENLKARPLDRSLDGLETAVWTRIDSSAKQDVFGGWTIQVQLAVSCAALLLGLLVAQFTGVSVMPMPLNSEIVVLSDDSFMAPSVRLEGGV
jgi:hypothetical protein